MNRNCIFLGVVLCSASAAFAQSPAPTPEMTLDEFRHYLDVLHIKEADERGVRAQSKAQLSQLPPWFPPAIWDEMVNEEIKVDSAPIEYSYVKSCASSPEISAITAMFATPEGQAYAAKMTGGMVDKEAQGVSATSAREEAINHDTGLPPAALKRLSDKDRELVLGVFARNGAECMSYGFQKASVDVTAARTTAARAVIAAHREELHAAAQKYETEHPSATK